MMCCVCLQIQRVLCSVFDLLAEQYSSMKEGLFSLCFPAAEQKEINMLASFLKGKIYTF